MLTAIATIAIFLVMISLHEFGHFIVAKLSGITVLEFSIGMGPAIFKREKGNTLYSVRALPIGGYCKMEGEDTQSEDTGAFCNQKLWKRFLVVVAGAVLNIVLGFVLFVLVAVISKNPYATNVISHVDERSNMYASGIVEGDRIVRINGHGVSFYRDIELYKDDIDSQKPVEMEIVRGGKRMKFSFMMSEEKISDTYFADRCEETTTMNGITQTQTLAYREGYVLPEDKIGTTDEYSRMMLGFSPVTKKMGVLSVFQSAYCNTKYVVKLVYKSLWDMLRGKVGIEEISGPIGVVGAVNQAVHSDYGLLSVLSMAALLTINLGIFNLLPIPALDGGRLLFMIIEFVRGKPVSAEREGMVHAIGLLLLLAFALLISVKDALQLFK